MLNENIIVTVIITYPVPTEYIGLALRIHILCTLYVYGYTHLVSVYHKYVYLTTIDTTPSAILLPNVAEVLRASFTA